MNNWGESISAFFAIENGAPGLFKDEKIYK